MICKEDIHILQEMGFENEAEFCRLVAAVNLTYPQQMQRFLAWKENDGSKSGLPREGAIR